VRFVEKHSSHSREQVSLKLAVDSDSASDQRGIEGFRRRDEDIRLPLAIAMVSRLASDSQL